MANIDPYIDEFPTSLGECGFVPISDIFVSKPPDRYSISRTKMDRIHRRLRRKGMVTAIRTSILDRHAAIVACNAISECGTVLRPWTQYVFLERLSVLLRWSRHGLPINNKTHLLIAFSHPDDLLLFVMQMPPQRGDFTREIIEL